MAFIAALLLLVMSWWWASRRRQRDNQLLQQLLEAAPTAIAFTDGQGRYQLVNARFANRLGVTPQAIHGGLPAALQPALLQWLGYLPGGPPFDGRFSADLKLRLCCHWLVLLDGGLGLLPADELAATTGLCVQLVLASVTT